MRKLGKKKVNEREEQRGMRRDIRGKGEEGGDEGRYRRGKRKVEG
jgi:hypothetical protein